MKKKLAMLLALVLAFGGTSAALLTSCKPTCTPDQNEQESEYKVRFLKEDGTLIEEKIVKHGEKVEAVTAPAKEGYTAEWVDKDGNVADLEKAVTADAEYKVRYTAKTDVAYKVEYYFENVEGAYELAAAETKNLTGTTGATVTAPEVTKEHYTLNTEAEGYLASGEVKGDGSLVLKMYYKLDRVTVTFMANGETLDTKQVIYGGKTTATDKAVPAKDQTVDKEFVFKHWSATENGAPYNWNLEVTGAITLYAVYEETDRTYYVTGTLADGALWYLAKDAEGSAAWVEDEKYSNGAIGLKYNENFVFALYMAPEMEGTPVVKAIKLDDKGETVSEEELTANEGFYTVQLDKNVRIEVSGIKVKTYELQLNASLAKYEQDWAYKTNTEDVILAVTDENGETTYHENALTSKIALPAGVYSAALVVSDGNGGYTTLAEIEEFEVSADALTEGKFVVPGEYVMYDGSYAIEGASGDWVIKDGKVYSTGDATDVYTVAFKDFVPGKADFVAMASYKLDTAQQNLESDPTLGFVFNDGDKKVFPALNRNGMRLRAGFGTTSANKDIAGLYPKYALGNGADHYDKLTEIVVKKDGAMYFFVTAERTDNTAIAKVTGKLIAVVTKDAIYTSNGTTYVASSATTSMFDEGISRVKMTFQMSKSCYGTMYGYAYSTDAAVIDSYLTNVALKATVTVDGEEKGTYDLVRGGEINLYENNIAIQLPAGKIAKTVTVNGEAAPYEVTDDGIVVTVNAGFTGAYAIAVTTEDGAYVKLTGYVMYDGEGVLAAKVTDGKTVAYTDANGKFELRALASEAYSVTVQAKGYKQETVNVTDITKEIEINLSQLMMGGTAMLKGVEYGTSYTAILPMTSGGKELMYEQGFDANGNETYTSVASSDCRHPIMFRNIASNKFIVKGSIKYNTIADKWICIGFIARDENGTIGSLMYYGNSGLNYISSTTADGWAVINGIENLSKGPNGDENGWKTGKWEVAMAYDNGKADLYLRNTLYFGTDKWYHLYSGNMITSTGDVLTGPVVVGMYETQNKNASFVMSDFFASTADNFDNLVEFANTDALDVHTVENGVVTVKAKEGYEITDIKLGANSYFAQATNESGTYKITLPGVWMVDGKQTVSVTTVEKSNFVAIGGKVNVAENFSKYYNAKNATITFKGESGEVSATAGEDGTWTIAEIAKGTYTVTATTEALKVVTEIEITEAKADINLTLNDKAAGYYKQISGNGIVKADNADELIIVGSGSSDTSFGGVTFVPNKQILEMQYTLTGNTSGTIYPWIGFFVGSDNKVARMAFGTGAGDCAYFLTKTDDYGSRTGVTNEPWLAWKAGFLTGQKAGQAPNGKGTYDAEAAVNLTVKLRVDGYKLTLSVKGTNHYRAANSGDWLNFNSEDWVVCYEANIYDRYNSDPGCSIGTGKKYLDQLYSLDQACYFGATHRQDAAVNGAYKFTNISFTITDKE